MSANILQTWLRIGTFGKKFPYPPYMRTERENAEVGFRSFRSFRCRHERRNESSVDATPLPDFRTYMRQINYADVDLNLAEFDDAGYARSSGSGSRC